MTRSVPGWLMNGDSGNHLFITNEQFGQQVAMFEAAGLRLRFRIDDPKASGAFLAYGDGRSDPAG